MQTLDWLYFVLILPWMWADGRVQCKYGLIVFKCAPLLYLVGRLVSRRRWPRIVGLKNAYQILVVCGLVVSIIGDAFLVQGQLEENGLDFAIATFAYCQV